MSYIIKLGAILLSFCIVASGILAYVNSKTAPIISDRKAKEEIETRKSLMPEASKFEETRSAKDSTFIYYVARNDQEKIVGYSFKASRNGYSGPVNTMVAVDTTFKILNIKVVQQTETPGLGANCVRDDFAPRFKGLSYEDMKVDKDGGKIVSMTGATITTRAITKSISEAINIVKTDLTNKITAIGGTQ